MLVVGVDGVGGLDAGLVRVGVILAGVFLVPVEDAADEGRNEGDFCLSAGDGLVESEEKGHVAVDALFFEDFGCLDALPSGGELDQDALAGDASGLILRD